MHESVNGIILNPERTHILLLKRRDVPVWVLPGGGIEDGESPEEAVLRELLEETGCEMKLNRKVGEYTPLCKLAKFTHTYDCTISFGIPKTGPETRDIEFFPLSKLPKMLPPPYPDWIKDALSEPTLLHKKPISSVTYSVMIKNLILHPILVIRYLLTKIGLTFNQD